MPVKALAPRVEAELLDIVLSVQSATFDDVTHSGVRLSSSGVSITRLHHCENADSSRESVSVQLRSCVALTGGPLRAGSVSDGWICQPVAYAAGS